MQNHTVKDCLCFLTLVESYSQCYWCIANAFEVNQIVKQQYQCGGNAVFVAVIRQRPDFEMKSTSLPGDSGENSIDPSHGSASLPNITSFHLVEFKH